MIRPPPRSTLDRASAASDVYKRQDIMFDKAVPVGIILNELLSNSIKHALPLNNSLTIIIAIKRIDNSICLEYSDNGQGFDSRLNNQNGMGQFLIKLSLIHISEPTRPY